MSDDAEILAVFRELTARLSKIEQEKTALEGRIVDLESKIAGLLATAQKAKDYLAGLSGEKKPDPAKSLPVDPPADPKKDTVKRERHWS